MCLSLVLCVVSPLGGRYVPPDKLDYLESENDKKVQRK
ncbi:hypothetical protein VCEM1676A_003060 [Vibrio cholerae O1 str. EM-1676A]|nr:hypothetical protein VCEM1676A_003060 [Vibrio cholerae O1 str. EM-1676A]